MYRTHTCGELRIANVGQTVTLSGWVQRIRKMGGMSFIDLRDRYGITQLVIDESASKEINNQAEKLGREYVIQIEGEVLERQSKNNKIDTGDIEVRISKYSSNVPTPPGATINASELSSIICFLSRIVLVSMSLSHSG